MTQQLKNSILSFAILVPKQGGDVPMKPCKRTQRIKEALLFCKKMKSGCIVTLDTGLQLVLECGEFHIVLAQKSSQAYDLIYKTQKKQKIAINLEGIRDVEPYSRRAPR